MGKEFENLIAKGYTPAEILRMAEMGLNIDEGRGKGNRSHGEDFLRDDYDYEEEGEF